MPSQPSGNGCGRTSTLALMVVALTLVRLSSASDEWIYGGVEAKVGEFPFIVSLQRRESGGASYHDCGGSILDDRHILTAAHCTLGDIEMFAMVGCYKLNDCKSEHKVARKVAHPKYSDSTGLYDIAVLELANPIVDLKSWPAPLSGDSFSMPKNCSSQYTVAGWGKTDDISSGSQVLMRVDVDLMDWAECKKNFPNVEEGLNFCAGSADQDSCQGDSGGTLYLHCASDDDVPIEGVQIGVVSYGQQGCGKGTGGVYTKVQSFLDWIREIVNSPK